MPKIDFRLYLITNRHLLAPDTLVQRIKMLTGEGVKAVQIREKDLSARQILELAEQIRNPCLKVFINERADLVFAGNTDGLHLPEHGLRVHEARKIIENKLIGKSTHSIESALEAESDGADFITFGPIYDTPSKRQYGAPLGIAQLQEAAKNISIPIFAIGGINSERAKECIAAGAYGVSVISDLLVTENPKLQVTKYLNALGSL